MNDRQQLAMAKRVLAGLAAGELDPGFFSEDFTFFADLTGRLDRQDFVAGVAQMKTILQAPLTMRAIASTQQGRRLALEAESVGVLIDGSEYRNSYHFLFVFDDTGKVNYLREYNNTRVVVELMWPLFESQGGFGTPTEL